MSRDELRHIEATVLYETDKAYRVSFARDTEPVWLPKSQLQRICVEGKHPRRKLICECPTWLLEDVDDEDAHAHDDVERDYMLDD